MKYPTSRLTPFPPTFARKIVCKRIENARNYARAPAIPLSTFKINTSKSVSKQRTLTPSRMNTYKKQGEGGPPPRQLSWSAPAPTRSGRLCVISSAHIRSKAESHSFTRACLQSAAESVGPLLPSYCRLSTFSIPRLPRKPGGHRFTRAKPRGLSLPFLLSTFNCRLSTSTITRRTSAGRRLTLR
jgi:hypothetical protein